MSVSVTSDTQLSDKLRNAVEVLGLAESQEAVKDGVAPMMICALSIINRVGSIFLDWDFGNNQYATVNFGVTCRELAELSPNDLDATILRRFKRAVAEPRVVHESEVDLIKFSLYKD